VAPTVIVAAWDDRAYRKSMVGLLCRPRDRSSRLVSPPYFRIR